MPMAHDVHKVVVTMAMSNQLRAASAQVYDHTSVGDLDLRDFPVVLDRLQQLKFAFAMTPQAEHALEFGVYTGGSIRTLAHAHKTQKFVGFGSFESLPDGRHRSETSQLDTGHFALETLPTVPVNVELVQGSFEDTFDTWLADHDGKFGFIHIDAGLYSAARFVLERLTDRLLDGAVIVFDGLGDWADSGVSDKWREGEWKAFLEWLEDTGFAMRVLSRDTRFAAAVQIFFKPPAAPTANEELGQATSLWNSDAKEQALAMAGEIAAARPGWVAGHHRLALWQTALKRSAPALETIQGIWDEAQKKSDHSHAIDLYRLRAENRFWGEDYKAAIKDSAHFIKQRPQQISGLTLYARIASKLGDHETASQTWLTAWHLTGNAGYLKHSNTERVMSEIRPDFRDMKFSGLMIQHLIDDRQFKTVLDIGSGTGEQARALRRNGKDVTELDYGESKYFIARKASEKAVIGDFMKVEFEEQFDCAIASHILEHQLNVNAFLVKLHSVVKEGGIIAISVPPLKDNIVGGHVTLWNAGLVLYNLVLAGFNCRNPWIRRYGYNISVVVEKQTISPTDLAYDTGDIDRLKAFLPEGFDEGFNGAIESLG